MAAKMAATVLLLVGMGLVFAEGGFGVEADSLPSLYTPYCPTGHLISQNASIALKDIFEPSRIMEQFPDVDNAQECYSRCCELASCNVASYITYNQGKVCALVYCASQETCIWQSYSTGYAAFVTREEPVKEETNTNTQTSTALVGGSQTDQTGTQTNQQNGSAGTSQTGIGSASTWQVDNQTALPSQDVTTAYGGDNDIWWSKNNVGDDDDDDEDYDEDYDWSSEESDEDDWLYESDKDDWSDDYDSESDEDDGDDDGYSNPNGKGNEPSDSEDYNDLDNDSDYDQNDSSEDEDDINYDDEDDDDDDDYEWDISKDKDMGPVTGDYDEDDDYDDGVKKEMAYEDGKPVIVVRRNSTYFVVVTLLVLLCLGGLVVVAIHYVVKRRTMTYRPLDVEDMGDKQPFLAKT